MRTPVTLLLSILFVTPVFGQQRFAELGNFTLDNGQVIQNCRIGYRTFGKLNATRSNAILVPTWFGGSSEAKAFIASPGNAADSTKYFTIVVDALGNGVSTSPSNSSAQPGPQFPAFSIRDMVRSQYELVTKTLKLPHLYAVLGISMGGMQSFEWLVSYPDFVDHVVPIVGTPKQSSYDRLFWGTQLTILERGNFSAEAMRTVGNLHELNLTTPSHFLRTLKAEDEPDFARKKEEGYSGRNPYDWASQLRAMIGQDIYRGRTAADLKALIKARLLVIVATQDHMVTPGTATELARALNVPLVELTGDCGHLATGCESDRINTEIGAFLGRR
ncbi:homoserine O-acetyltransferase [Spirosoma lacussanchae]|uniref:alpha/beta fold hydrolase n=1 Tax=Spirosoma lacussanchae TaxID=1884249 RepID=UPI001108007C|nr:alpha/beta fold hydrolase [Spirosoma lacussanchae]